MPASIKVDQAAKPPGVAGVAREDLATGVDVQLTAVGGPFADHLWRIIHKPIDIFSATRSSAALATPNASASLLTPINVAGTYHIELAVDSGSGLGANAGDIARITFYCGPTLSSFPDRFPRRIPAFAETTEHNVPDAVDPSGNLEGWSKEWYRWFAVIQRLYEGRVWARGRVSLPPGGPATLVRGFNVASVNRTAQGIVEVTFLQALPDANYAARANGRGTIGGSAVCNTEGTNTMVVERADLGGSLVDADFVFEVALGA